MAMRNAKTRVQCEICGKTVLKKGFKKHVDMAHGEGQKYAFSSVINSSDFENGFQKRVNEIEVSEKAEKREENPVGYCPNCTAREIEMQRLKTEVIPGLKTESENREKELTEKLAAVSKQLAEKAAAAESAEAIPEELEAVIAHCEDGSCASHARQWQAIQRRIVEAKKSSIIQATLENLPDAVVEQEGLRRGFIPTKIIIPMSIRAPRR